MMQPDSVELFPEYSTQTPINLLDIGEEWDAVRLNEYVRFRVTFSRWVQDIIPKIEECTRTTLSPEVITSIGQMQAYHREVGSLSKVLEEIKQTRNLNDEEERRAIQHHGVFPQFFPEYTLGTTDTVHIPIPSDLDEPWKWDSAFYRHGVVLHEIGNGSSTLTLAVKYGFDAIEKHAVVERLQEMQLVAMGEMPKHPMSARQVQERLHSLCSSTKKLLGDAVWMGAVTIHPLDHELKNVPLVWSQLYVAGLVENVFQNLERMYTTTPLMLDVRFECVDGFFLIHMDDNGKGFPTEPVNLIGRNPFQQGVSIRPDGVSGQGIGMYGLQETIVDVFGGYLETQNRPGGRLTVALPIITSA